MRIGRQGIKALLSMLFTGVAVTPQVQTYWASGGPFKTQGECNAYIDQYCGQWCEYIEQTCFKSKGEFVPDKTCKSEFLCS
jgi:hypothetical protein